jgi:hypothetical protein
LYRTVITVLLAMFGILVVAGLVVVYVAYPHRGQDVPTAPWVGEAMRKGVRRLPTLDNQSDEQKYETAGAARSRGDGSR